MLLTLGNKLVSFWLPPGSHKKIYQWQLHRKISRGSKCNVQYGKFQELVNQWWAKAVSKHHRTEQHLVCCLNTQIMIELDLLMWISFLMCYANWEKGECFWHTFQISPQTTISIPIIGKEKSSYFTDSSQIIIDNCYLTEINVRSRFLLYFINASEVPDTLI